MILEKGRRGTLSRPSAPMCSLTLPAILRSGSWVRVGSVRQEEAIRFTSPWWWLPSPNGKVSLL